MIGINAMEVHEKIKVLRSLKNLSQEEMASKLGISTHAYAKIERGETDVNLSRLQEIAQVLAIDLAQLFGLNEKNIFNFIGVVEIIQSNLGSQHHSFSMNLGYSHELEKKQLIIEKLELEISYLKQQVIDLRRGADEPI
ncbi:MAG: helix-turn-helix domain-containing protein [Thiotrichaceae bacterium]